MDTDNQCIGEKKAIDASSACMLVNRDAEDPEVKIECMDTKEQFVHENEIYDRQAFPWTTEDIRKKSEAIPHQEMVDSDSNKNKSEEKSNEVDIEILITFVHDHPVLWDKTAEEYKDRIPTRNAWAEVCRALHEGFEELSDKHRNDYCKMIMKKWANIRDSFQRNERNYRASLKSGSGRQVAKSYIYSEQLQFLKKRRRTEDNISVESEDPISEHGAQETQTESAGDKFSEAVVPRFKKPQQRHKRKRKLDPVQLELINAIKTKPDRHMSFFQGIIPSLEKFDDDEVVEFQLKVMQVLSEMKNRKKSTANIVPPAMLPLPLPNQYNQHMPRHSLTTCNAKEQYQQSGSEICVESSSPASDFSDSSSIDLYHF